MMWKDYDFPKPNRNLDDEALHALTQKVPKNAKHNFYVDLSEYTLSILGFPLSHCEETVCVQSVPFK